MRFWGNLHFTLGPLTPVCMSVDMHAGPLYIILLISSEPPGCSYFICSWKVRLWKPVKVSHTRYKNCSSEGLKELGSSVSQRKTFENLEILLKLCLQGSSTLEILRLIRTGATEQLNILKGDTNQSLKNMLSPKLLWAHNRFWYSAWEECWDWSSGREMSPRPVCMSVDTHAGPLYIILLISSEPPGCSYFICSWKVRLWKPVKVSHTRYTLTWTAQWTSRSTEPQEYQ